MNGSSRFVPYQQVQVSDISSTTVRAEPVEARALLASSPSTSSGRTGLSEIRRQSGKLNIDDRKRAWRSRTHPPACAIGARSCLSVMQSADAPSIVATLCLSMWSISTSSKRSTTPGGTWWATASSVRWPRSSRRAAVPGLHRGPVRGQGVGDRVARDGQAGGLESRRVLLSRPL